MIRRLYRLLPHPALLLRLGTLHAIMAVLQGLLLGLLAPILHALLSPDPDWDAAEPWLIAGAVGLVLYGALSITATPVGFAASMKLGSELRKRVMRHVTVLPLGWFSADHKARLARAVTADVTRTMQLAVTIGAGAITSTLTSATVLAIAFVVDWRMALVLLAVVPFAFLALRRAGQITARIDVQLALAADEIAGRAVEFGQAQTVLRAAGQATEGSVHMRAALDRHHEVYRHGLRRAAGPDFTYVAIAMAGFVAMLGAGALLLLDGTVSIADAVVLLILSVRFLEPLGSLIELIGGLRAMDNAIRRVDDLLHSPSLPRSATPVGSVAHATVEFRDVRFAYGTAPALDGVSFRCSPGTVTALVGPSGSGKSTVIRLIARFFDVDAGAVTVGDVDVRALEPDALMEELAIVFQDVYLFHDTIEANVRLARPDATPAELEDAARAARLDEVVERLPAGWQTPVGEGGAQLSGGERQRVALARAFLKRARIVLLDEASSALDPENEAAIGRAIAALAEDPDRTLIVIAHRPATLASADQVVALERGLVSEAGPPTELLVGDGSFARLHRQFEDADGWRISTRRT